MEWWTRPMSTSCAPESAHLYPEFNELGGNMRGNMMRPALLFAAALTAAGLFGPPAGAAVIFAIKPATISAPAPSTGDIFDVVLTNTGPGSVLLDGFSFEISV